MIQQASRENVIVMGQQQVPPVKLSDHGMIWVWAIEAEKGYYAPGAEFHFTLLLHGKVSSSGSGNRSLPCA